jgi:hypothetical protein
LRRLDAVPVAEQFARVGIDECRLDAAAPHVYAKNRRHVIELFESSIR